MIFSPKCRHCGKQEVVLTKIYYEATLRHGGVLHTFGVPDLEIPVCQACGEKVFTLAVEYQIDDAFKELS